MKKKLLLLALITFATASFSPSYAAVNGNDNDSASTTTTEVKVKKATKSRYNHWYLGVKGGFNVFDGDIHPTNTAQQIFPTSQLRPTVKARVGYDISPLWGFSLEYDWLQYHAENNSEKYTRGVDGTAHEVALYGHINLLNLFQSCRKHTEWALLFNLGIGASFSSWNSTWNPVTHKPDTVDLFMCAVIPVGLEVEYCPHPAIGIGLGFEYRVHTSDYLDGHTTEGTSSDNFGSVSLGLKWKIGGQNPNRPHVSNLSLCEYQNNESGVNDRLEQLEKQVSDLNDVINDEVKPDLNKVGDDVQALRDSLDKLRPQVLAPARDGRDGAGKVGKDGANAETILAVFFDNDSDDPTLSDYNNQILASVALQLYKNPSATIEITAFCDGPASVDYNQKLSERRANNVKKLLVEKYGIKESRIKCNANGRLVEPIMQTRANRRCEIFIKK